MNFSQQILQIKFQMEKNKSLKYLSKVYNFDVSQTTWDVSPYHLLQVKLLRFCVRFIRYIASVCLQNDKKYSVSSLDRKTVDPSDSLIQIAALVRFVLAVVMQCTSSSAMEFKISKLRSILKCRAWQAPSSAT